MLSATAKAGMGVAPAVGVGSLGRVAPRRAARAAHLGVAPPRRGVRATPWSRRPGSVRLAGTCCCAQLLACSCPESATWLDPSLTTRAFAPRGASLACVVARAWTRHVSITVSLRGAAFVLARVLAESCACASRVAWCHLAPRTSSTCAVVCGSLRRGQAQNGNAGGPRPRKQRERRAHTAHVRATHTNKGARRSPRAPACAACAARAAQPP
jgi:hypothetical protein